MLFLHDLSHPHSYFSKASCASRDTLIIQFNLILKPILKQLFMFGYFQPPHFPFQLIQNYAASFLYAYVLKFFISSAFAPEVASMPEGVLLNQPTNHLLLLFHLLLLCCNSLESYALPHSPILTTFYFLH